MRAFLPAYEMETPRDLAATLERMAAEPGVWRAFAGGTDLMVLLEAGKLAHKKFLNIWNLAELRGIAVTAEHVTLGALTTYAAVQRHEILAREFPLLCRAAAETGSVATQNRGTLGGNIANASPAADSPPALIVYGAEIETVSAGGARWVPYASFHTGYKKMNLGPGEVIRSIRVARPGGAPWKQYFRKVGTRRAQAISKICFAGVGRVENGRIAEVRIALGSVAPMVLRAVRAEEILRGQRPEDAASRHAAQEALGAEIAPIDDMRSTGRYRRNVARNLLAEFLEVLAS
jgi:CO/xanthine dehydrogenase FAD-binding subunit